MIQAKQFSLMLVLLITGFQLNAGETIDLPQAIQKALQYRTELKSAKLNTQSAALGLSITESQLGWQATASAGVQHGLDTFGQTTEQQRLSAGLIKQQRSGDQISLLGSYQKDESDTAAAGVFPNPLESYGVNLDYRMPLQQGKGNPEYTYAEKQATTGFAVSAVQLQQAAEQISEQLIGIYHRLIDIQIQRQENLRAVKRTKKLESFIKRNSQLGMAENKDQLSVQARLVAQMADKARLSREWQSQLSEFRKMTGDDSLYHGVKRFSGNGNLPKSLEEIVDMVLARDAVVLSNKENIALAEAQIQLSRNQKKDQLDIVLSIGNETRQGHRAAGAIDENEWVGGVRIEYKLPLDRRGVDGKMQQSWLALDQLRMENHRYEADLKSQLSQWYQEWKMTETTSKLYHKRKKIEQLRYEEVKTRYREGRTDIREMLDADESLSTADKLLDRELARRSLMLSLLSNRLGFFVAGIEN